MNWKTTKTFLNLEILMYLLTALNTVNASNAAKQITVKFNPNTNYTNNENLSTTAAIISKSTVEILSSPSSLPITQPYLLTTTQLSVSSTEPTIPFICTKGIQNSNKASAHVGNDGIFNGNYNNGDDNLIQIIEGDAILSVLTKDPISALFVGNRINQANLISGDFELGMRVININEATHLENLLLQEVEYLQLCTEHPIGVFVDFDAYKLLENTINDLEYNIWPIPSTRNFLFPKVAHLLYQMPWGDRTASVEILAENLNVYNDFMDAARNEHLCLMHFRSNENIYVFLGNKMIINFKENGTIFAIPTGRTDKSFIADLPGNSYVLMESEVELKTIDENSTLSTLDTALIGKNILSSELLAISGPLLDLTHWLNESLSKKCEQSNGIIYFESCYDFLNFINDWSLTNSYYSYKPIDILEKLKIRKIAHLMTFEMFQKVVTKLNVTGGGHIEELVELREIASQNFITNLTTYFHYNQANETKHEMKSKFGQIFNCQYADGTNRKFPFYVSGESVMYWRLKSDAWIAAGLTTSILGIMISVAILVFIIVRITVGDVFEGNPISSIALLVSLILLFFTFIPFSLDYTAEHRNSRVTYEDADIMNTLCAVRVFLITICYCLTFSLLLCRALMLASIGSEGGFLSHVNGYVQAVICVFSALVQIGLSTQLLIVMHIANESVSCENIYNGNWLWLLLTYDFLLLIFLVVLTPLIYRSQRNYREGILLVIGTILTFLVWCTWIPMSFFGPEWRDAAIALGIQATGWAILIGILIPRAFLIVRGIERSDIAQTLPSLTSLAFAQNNQFPSEQSVYECVNPAMRYSASREDGMCEIGPNDHHHHNRNTIQSPSEIPTLPLRGAGTRRSVFQNMRNNNASVARRPSYASSQSSLPPSPNKITRF